MTEKKKKYNFYENIKQLSEIKDDDLVCDEWVKIKIANTMKRCCQDGVQCICGRVIHNYWIIHNILNGNMLFAGSKCQTRFKKRDFNVNPRMKQAHNNVMEKAEYRDFNAEMYKYEMAIQLYLIYSKLIKKSKLLEELDNIRKQIDNLILLKNNKELYDKLISKIEDKYEQEELKPYLVRLDIDIDTFSNMCSSKNKKQKEKSDNANYTHIEKTYYNKLIYCDEETRYKLVNEIKEIYVFFTKKYYEMVDELIKETNEIRSSNMKERWNV